MKYVSTRGHMDPAGFTEILLEGLGPDGGLVVPESYPRFTTDELDHLRTLDYAGLALEVLHRFADDIPRAELTEIVDRTYTAAVFGTADIAPVSHLDENLHLLHLSNGPTLAFKDMAMQFLGNVFEHVLSSTGQELNILGATSGDTGSAAEHAMAGKRGVRVFMLSPKGKTSPFQAAQMYSLTDANIHNLVVRGVFDDCQDVVKRISQDLEFKRAYRLGAVNSINWARVAAQVVYYFWGWFKVTTSTSDPVSFAVPSGNFGNILAGHVAREMGLPVDRLILATNENDVLDEFFRTAAYRVRPASAVHATSSPSMDISKASNFERFVFDLTGRDAAATSALFRAVDTDGGFDLRGTPWAERLAASPFLTGRSTHHDRLETIRRVYARTGTVIDPHTADGVKVALETAHRRDPSVPVLCLETALPVKFSSTIVEALGREPDRPERFRGIEERPQRFVEIGPDDEAVKAIIRAATGAPG